MPRRCHSRAIQTCVWPSFTYLPQSHNLHYATQPSKPTRLRYLTLANTQLCLCRFAILHACLDAIVIEFRCHSSCVSVLAWPQGVLRRTGSAAQGAGAGLESSCVRRYVVVVLFVVQWAGPSDRVLPRCWTRWSCLTNHINNNLSHFYTLCRHGIRRITPRWGA